MLNRVGQAWRLLEETDEGDRFVSLCFITEHVEEHDRYDGLVLDDAYAPDVGTLTRMDSAEAFREPSEPHEGSRFRWERVA